MSATVLPITQGRVTFKFDDSKARNTSGYKAAKAQWLADTGKKRIPNHHEMHHIDWDRANGDASNLYVCSNSKEHGKLHGQMIQFVSECIKIGLLGFDHGLAEYFVNEPGLARTIKRFRGEDGFARHNKKDIT